MINKSLVSSIAIACAVFGAVVPAAHAAECSGTIRVLAQPRDGLTLLENYKDEFTKLSGGADFQIDYLNENDRRAKTKADASTIGKYNVYYIDEANVALFASSGWVAPLLDYYPKDYDYTDFDPGRQKVATYDGKAWFAPLTGGGDLMVYRKDLLEAAGIQPPKTLDEYVAAVEKLNQPDKGIYGTALRGQRGSGANVWRWMPFFKGFGGNWFDGKTPVFNSEAAVKATETYLKIFKSSAPGSQTGGWDEAVGAFTSGQVAMLIESTPLVGMALDKKSSQVADKIGYLPPPTPLTGGGYGHGLAIGTKANADDAAKQCAGLFIGWATSKENEQRRLEEGQFSELNRTSVMTSDKFAELYGPDLGQALAETGKVTAVNFWQNAQWPDLGDRWGIILEELITGTRTDIKDGLDELDGFAKDLVARSQ
ncbi:ABC transporter substrate-binding protein [Pararhizobium sp. O133]|uniref:ABC transporter substrate-binding protein n=1 Tax=Pararhizobium sp. O133 TaxID=3449278 RepID=UPI003F6869C9